MLSNRIAIITGGGSGIGRAVCQLFAKENASVVIVDISVNDAQETLRSLDFSERHLVVETDIRKSDSVSHMYDAISRKYDNKVATILVNCAAIARDSLMNKTTEENFDEVIDVNLKGTFLCTKAFCQLVIANKVTEGSIINMSSIGAKIGNIGQCNYVASKAAVEGFSRTVAREMAKYNIRCNVVMPGLIDTQFGKLIPEKIRDLIVKQTPLLRIGTPDEVAQVIAFLASNKSSFVTGQIIEVSGGLFMSS